ncbi:unnamed protein product [Ostreobium quekettii]|uniref:Protein kinase domain-containing protein n=1 Tax=Ostreobium quekettii TaxID=121088 RepID=A0A8S1IZF0_9CHLO|nr:unnamed protein product [Ostreobium quekettii]
MDFALYLREILFHDSVNGHPQIVKLLAVTFSGWIVMEKADCNLSTLCFAGEGLSWRSKARLLCQASTALAYLHSKSRVHKNVKLQNFLVSGTDPETCQLKISDFLLTVEQTASRSERVRIGDSGLSYTAPEFYDGNSTSFMSDVYGFGVLCHEVISGQKSYDGEGADHFAIMTKKLDGEPPCQVKGRDCPSAAMELMRRCCTSEPEIRPTMEQVKNALMQLPEQWVFGEQEQSRGQDALYNVKIMCFLDAQLEKLKGFEAPATPQQADFEEELGKGKHLLEKHANHFDIGDFCRTRDACHAVQEICGHLKDTLQLWDLQEEVNLQDQIPTEDVEEDQELLHKLLNFVLKDVPCSIEETLMKHWKEIKARHVESMKHVKVIGEGELQMGQLLGEGSRGTVYSAVWRSIDVVVKKPVWRGSMVGQGELPIEDFAEFSKEVISHASMNDHPQIVKLLAATTSGRMVLEKAKCDLHMLCFADEGLPWRSKVRLLRQGSTALAYLHSKGQVHRDIKLQNFLMFDTDPGTCLLKISDFGQDIMEIVSTVTKTVRISDGTLQYAAPEVYKGKPTSAKSDVYGFGVLCYEMVSGQKSYGGERANRYVIMKSKLNGKPPCQVQDRDCPPAVLELMRLCCAIDPADRPTMEEVKNKLMHLPGEWVFEEPIASEVQHGELPQASVLMYNQGMMGFLEEQLIKARAIQKPADKSAVQLNKYDHEVKKGERLLKKHQRFDIKGFYRIDDARRAVEAICSVLLLCLEEWGMQRSGTGMDLKSRIPQELVDGDKQHMYMLLAYVLKGQTLTSELRQDWEVVKADHEEALRGLKVISDEELQIGEKIGEGGYGSVYKAEWKSKTVAVKDVVPFHHYLSLEDFAAFFKEASIQALLTFHHVTPLYAITKSGRMVMELASCDLASLSRREQLPWPAKRRTLHQAALGLKHLHSRSPPLIHRDVKSSNFLIFGNDPDTWTVKVSDFGLTGECTKSVSKTVRGGGGTLEWMAPEVFLRKPLTLASDVFSMGVMMYEVVTGQHPYGVKSLDAKVREAVVTHEKSSENEPAKVQQGQCPQEMLDLMRRCISFDAKARPTIDEICEALATMGC